MTLDEIRSLIFCVRWTYSHLAGRLQERERIAAREGQDVQDSQLARCLRLARGLADRLEAKYLPPKPEGDIDGRDI